MYVKNNILKPFEIMFQDKIMYKITINSFKFFNLFLLTIDYYTYISNIIYVFTI